MPMRICEGVNYRPWTKGAAEHGGVALTTGANYVSQGQTIDSHAIGNQVTSSSKYKAAWTSWIHSHNAML